MGHMIWPISDGSYEIEDHNLMKFSDHVTYKPTDEYYKVISDWEKEHPDW